MQQASRTLRRWTVSFDREKDSEPTVRMLGSGYFECVVHYSGQLYRGISIDPLEATKRAFGLAGKRGGAYLR
jgi:hypothetical protein